MKEPNYKGQYEIALKYKQTEDAKRDEEIEKLRKNAEQRLAELLSIVHRAHDNAKKGHLFHALQGVRNGFQWWGGVLSDLERAHEGQRLLTNVFLVPLGPERPERCLECGGEPVEDRIANTNKIAHTADCPNKPPRGPAIANTGNRA